MVDHSLGGCARRAWRSSERRGRRSQTNRGSLSPSQQSAESTPPCPCGVAFSAASDAAVRSLHRGRTDQTPETVRGVAGRSLLLQVLGTRDTGHGGARGSRLNAPARAENGSGSGSGVAWWVARRFHAHMRAVARRGRVGERGRHEPLRLSASAVWPPLSYSRSYGNGTHYRCLTPCMCTRPAAEPTATLHASREHHWLK